MVRAWAHFAFVTALYGFALCGVLVGEVAFISNPPGTDLCAVAKHEIGDLLGLTHRPGGIMRADYGWWTRCRVDYVQKN